MALLAVDGRAQGLQLKDLVVLTDANGNDAIMKAINPSTTTISWVAVKDAEGKEDPGVISSPFKSH